MAISQGAGPHFAWIAINGAQFPVTTGSAEQRKQKKSGSFCCDVPMDYPGAYSAFTSIAQSEDVTITVSTRGTTGTLLTGQAEHVDFQMIRRNIRITGHDESAKLHQTKVAQKWQNQTGGQIVQQLAGMAGLGASIDQSLLMAGKTVNQDYARLADNISIASVIHKLAQFDGARWYVLNGTLYYLTQDNPSGSYSLNYQPPSDSPVVSDCLDLSFLLNVPVSAGGTVTVKSWHPKKAQAFTGTATFGIGGALQYVFHIPNLLQDHAQQHAQAKANELSQNKVTVRAEVVGDPTINVAMDLQVSGTGEFDDTYQMDCVKHSFGMGGHHTSILARTKAAA